MQLKLHISQLHYPDRLRFLIAPVPGIATARLVDAMEDLVNKVDKQELAHLLAEAGR